MEETIPTKEVRTAVPIPLPISFIANLIVSISDMSRATKEFVRTQKNPISVPVRPRPIMTSEKNQSGFSSDCGA
jgi:hypothetical protein